MKGAEGPKINNRKGETAAAEPQTYTIQKYKHTIKRNARPTKGGLQSQNHPDARVQSE